MPIQEDLQAFLAEWHDPSPFLEVQTSGSTGTPKRMRVRKDRMLNSARLTCDYLGLKKGDKALLCMPLRYIAGKMMVVRSLYAGLDLEVREPSGQGNPLPQGLGTGEIFKDDKHRLIQRKGDTIWFTNDL